MGVPGLPAGSDQGGAARPGLGRGLLLSCPRDAPRGAGSPCGRSRPSLPRSEDSLVDVHGCSAKSSAEPALLSRSKPQSSREADLERSPASTKV